MDREVLSSSKLRDENGFKGKDILAHCVPLALLPFEKDISILKCFGLLMNQILGQNM